MAKDYKNNIFDVIKNIDNKNYEIINVGDKNIVINLNEYLDYLNIKAN